MTVELANTIRFEEEGHRYTYGDQEVPSVTQIIDAMCNKNRMGYSNYHAGKGKFIHKATELDDAGTLDDKTVDPVVLPYLEGWRKFRAETGASVLSSETVVYSRKLRYAGTFDRILKFNPDFGYGRRQMLVDIKSGSPDKWHPLQVAAYLYAYAPDEYGLFDAGLVYLRKTGTYKFAPVDPFELEGLINKWRDMVNEYWASQWPLW